MAMIAATCPAVRGMANGGDTAMEYRWRVGRRRMRNASGSLRSPDMKTSEVIFLITALLWMTSNALAADEDRQRKPPTTFPSIAVALDGDFPADRGQCKMLEAKDGVPHVQLS